MTVHGRRSTSSAIVPPNQVAAAMGICRTFELRGGGGVRRFGPPLGIPTCLGFSGHNKLWFAAMPTDATDEAMFVGYASAFVDPLFESCSAHGQLDNGVGVESEEQGLPITACTETGLCREITRRNASHLD